MNRQSALFLVVCAACGEASPPAPIATEPVWHLEVSMAEVHGDLGPAAVGYLEDAGLGLSSEEDWQLLSVVVGADTLGHARVQELHRGVPVLGSEIAVHADDTTFLGYGGTVTRNLEGFDVEPAIDGDRALARARQHVSDTIRAAIEPDREAHRLAIQPRDGVAALVWQVEMLVVAQVGVPPGRWFIQIDAGSGEVLAAYDGLASAEQASGPGGNAKVQRTWSAELDVEPSSGGFAMETRRLTTLDLHHGKEGGDVVIGPLDPIGDAEINDAHGNAEITLKMMRDWMGYDSINGSGFPIVSRVHYDEGYANAFWDGERMTYGDGGDKFYPLSGGLDVVAHEINHGFTEKHSNLEYWMAPGGLNESFSDIAGALVEYYIGDDGGAFLIGEDVVKEGVSLRSMCDPHSDGHSIDWALDIYHESDPHYTSGISNKAFCLSVARYVATGASHADSVRWMGQVWYLANAGYWTCESTFSQGCQGTVDAARALGFTDEAVVAIQQSWADVGVYCESGLDVVCDADGICDGGDGETCYSCATDCGSCSEDCSYWKELKCSFGIGDCSHCSRTPSCGDGVCAEDESDDNCGQDCGCRAPGDSCGSLAPYGCWCDSACEENGDCCSDAEVCE